MKLFLLAFSFIFLTSFQSQANDTSTFGGSIFDALEQRGFVGNKDAYSPTVVVPARAPSKIEPDDAGSVGGRTGTTSVPDDATDDED